MSPIRDNSFPWYNRWLFGVAEYGPCTCTIRYYLFADAAVNGRRRNFKFLRVSEISYAIAKSSKSNEYLENIVPSSFALKFLLPFSLDERTW